MYSCIQVSYLMVDQADMDLEMAEDPFLEVSGGSKIYQRQL